MRSFVPWSLEEGTWSRSLARTHDSRSPDLHPRTDPPSPWHRCPVGRRQRCRCCWKCHRRSSLPEDCRPRSHRIRRRDKARYGTPSQRKYRRTRAPLVARPNSPVAEPSRPPDYWPRIPRTAARKKTLGASYSGHRTTHRRPSRTIGRRTPISRPSGDSSVVSAWGSCRSQAQGSRSWKVGACSVMGRPPHNEASRWARSSVASPCPRNGFPPRGDRRCPDVPTSRRVRQMVAFTEKMGDVARAMAALVSREQRALDDIEAATGKRPEFTPYDQ